MDMATRQVGVSAGMTGATEATGHYMPLRRADGEAGTHKGPDTRRGTFIQVPSADGALTIEHMKPVAGKDADESKLRGAAREFEAIFIRKLLATMRTPLNGEGMFGSGPEAEIYGDMFDNALAEVMSSRGVLGMGERLYRTLSLPGDHDVTPETTSLEMMKSPKEFTND